MESIPIPIPDDKPFGTRLSEADSSGHGDVTNARKWSGISKLSRRISREQDISNSQREELIWATYQGEVDSMLRGLSLQMDRLQWC